MKTYQDVETFKVLIHDLQFEEAFHPMEEVTYEDLNRIKVFFHINALKFFAAGKLIQFVPAIPGKRPAIWYVRLGFGRYLPCSTNLAMDEFTRSKVFNS